MFFALGAAACSRMGSRLYRYLEEAWALFLVLQAFNGMCDIESSPVCN
jgi:hypothetical protein